MFKIEIYTKSEKVYALQVQQLETFTNAISKNEIIWLDGGAKGIFIPPSEVAQILFERLAEPAIESACGDVACPSVCEPCEPCNEPQVTCFDPEAEARAAALIHQQQHIEG